MKTIKQLADELGISKQALNKRIDNLGCRNQLSKSGNLWLIPESAENTIKNQFTDNQKATTKPTTEPTTVDTLVDTLLKQLDEKDNQIKAKDEQILKLQKLIDQEQQLHMATKQELLALEDKQAEKKKWFWQRKKLD